MFVSRLCKARTTITISGCYYVFHDVVKNRQLVQNLNFSYPFPLSRFCHVDSEAPNEKFSPNFDCINTVDKTLKFNSNNSELEQSINQFSLERNEETVLEILKRFRADWKLAFAFFNWASEQPNYSHGSSSYNEMLDIIGRMKQTELMRQVFDEIPKTESIINEETFSILLNRYASAHKVQEATDLFYKRKEYGFDLNTSSFQTLLISLCRFKHVEEAEYLFQEKLSEFPPDIKSWNIILNGWCVMGSLHNAKRIWNEIISSDFKPDSYTYSIYMNALCKNGKIGSAEKLYTTMKKKGIKPDVLIYNCIINVLCYKKRIPQALNMFDEMPIRGCEPDIATYNTLIKYLCKIKRLEKVYELMSEMENKGYAPNIITYTYILKTKKSPKEISQVLGEMKNKGVSINGDTYNLILGLYVEWGFVNGITEIWTEMEKNGLGPDQRSYTIMIHGFYSQGKFNEALRYYNEMESKELIPEPRTRILIKEINLKIRNS